MIWQNHCNMRNEFFHNSLRYGSVTNCYIVIISWIMIFIKLNDEDMFRYTITICWQTYRDCGYSEWWCRCKQASYIGSESEATRDHWSLWTHILYIICLVINDLISELLISYWVMLIVTGLHYTVKDTSPHDLYITAWIHFLMSKYYIINIRYLFITSLSIHAAFFEWVLWYCDKFLLIQQKMW